MSADLSSIGSMLILWEHGCDGEVPLPDLDRLQDDIVQLLAEHGVEPETIAAMRGHAPPRCDAGVVGGALDADTERRDPEPEKPGSRRETPCRGHR